MSGNKTTGFTLIELMLGLAIWMVVATSLAGAFRQGLHMWKQTEKTTPLYQEARVTLDRIAREFQNSLDVPGKNWTADETSIAFATVQSNGVTHVTYRLVPLANASVLERGAPDTMLEQVKESLSPEPLHRPAERTALTTRPTRMAWEYAYRSGNALLVWKSEWKKGAGDARPAGVRVHLTLYDDKNEPTTFTKTIFLPTTEELTWAS